MTGSTFVDTNVLIYAHDVDAGRKREIASALLDELWERRSGLLSVQVLQEFYVNATRKIAVPIARADARDIVGRYSAWVRKPIEPATVLAASRLEEQHRLSFWDALIVAAARSAGAVRIVTEDLSDGLVIEDIELINPFVRGHGTGGGAT
jgi:predicted nucleic acid-binding protein